MKQINKIKCHSKLDLESSTLAVSQRPQQALKMLNQVQHDGSFYTRGFTLIELLVVVLIIGILAAVAMPQYQFAIDKTRVMGNLQNAQQIIKAEQLYFLANGAYTPKMADLDIDLTKMCNTQGGSAGSNELYNCPGGFGFDIVAQYDQISLPESLLLKYCQNNTSCSSSAVSPHFVARIRFTDGKIYSCIGNTTRGKKICNWLNQQF